MAGQPFLHDLVSDGVAKVTNLPAPSNDSDAATKGYVDSAVEGLNWKDSVRVASTANLTISGPGAAIDGVTLSANDRVLVKDQSDASENGIYIFNGAAVAMTRAVDADSFAKLEQATVTVEEGTANEGATFRQTELNGTLDTDDLLFVSFGSDTPAATTTVAGKVELATQAEVDTGTDADRAVTPATLAGWSGRMREVVQTIGDGSATSFNVDHNLNNRDVTVEVFRNSGSYESVIADVTRPTVNRVTVAFAAAPASSAFRVVVHGRQQ